MLDLNGLCYRLETLKKTSQLVRFKSQIQIHRALTVTTSRYVFIPSAWIVNMVNISRDMLFKQGQHF